MLASGGGEAEAGARWRNGKYEGDSEKGGEKHNVRLGG